MKTVQIIKCKCGEIFAGCLVPYCYEDADWQKDLRKYVKQGCTVDILHASEFKFSKCTCKEIKNQTKLL